MPIGKNAIKRVANNGYSNVKTTAPDMENSVQAIESGTDAGVAKAKKATAKKTTVKAAPKTQAPKKTTKKAPTAPTKKSMEVEPTFSPVKTAEKVIEATVDQQARQGDGYINLGGELPIHLL